LICDNNKVNGIAFNGVEIKPFSYADDITATLASSSDAKELFAILTKFGKVSGLNINKEKTEGLWLGQDQHSLKQPFGIKWRKEVKL
jgi:hypothetical protein